MTLRQIIVRKDLIIPSDSDSKRALLVGYLSLLSIAISLFYLIYNSILSIDDSRLSYLLLMTGSMTSLLLNRKGFHMAAKLFFLSTVNLNNGVGIPAEHLPRVFEMFYRASENSKGSGLGLYIVKETIEKLGGSIQIKSVYGKGSEFTITLPH